MIHVILPTPLREFAQLQGDIALDLDLAAAPLTPRRILDELDRLHPRLQGTIRDPLTGNRRPYLRFYACNEDVSNDPLDAELPAAIASGTEPFIVMGAVSGG